MLRTLPAPLSTYSVLPRRLLSGADSLSSRAGPCHVVPTVQDPTHPPTHRSRRSHRLAALGPAEKHDPARCTPITRMQRSLRCAAGHSSARADPVCGPMAVCHALGPDGLAAGAEYQ